MRIFSDMNARNQFPCMMLDIKLTQLGLKIKNLVVLDHVSTGKFPEFKAYDQRYIRGWCIRLAPREGSVPLAGC
jgi:hypothetical protein